MTRFQIQLISDMNCPWCYLGKKSLDRAMETYKEQHPDAEFDVIWRPYYLYPEAKPSGYTKREYYTAKFGPAGLPGFFSRVEAGGRALGIEFDWAGRTGTTRDAHKLLLLAQRRRHAVGQQQQQQQQQPDDDDDVMARLHEALFRGQFEGGGRDVSDRAFLAQAAVEAGLARTIDEACRCLDSEGAGREADASDREAKRMGVTAVPSYLVQGRYRVGGFQEPEFLVGLFEKIAAAEGSEV